jgi:Ser/Thr protein kinase RdoA (MazF antagonist)
LWDAVSETLESVRESENFVYRFRDPAGGERYLRITPNERRSVDQLTAEIDFVLYLHEHGVKLAPPVKSLAGNWIETIESPQGTYNLTVWEAIYGETVKWGLDRENRRYLFERGKALGKIHRLAQSFRPGEAQRHHWWEDELFTDPVQFLPESDVAQRQEYNTLFQWLVKRPRTPQNYGMTHGDFGSGNTRHANGEVVCFDFDDCSFHWYAYDLAVAIRAGRKLPFKYRKAYLQVLMDGYSQENSLNGDTAVEVAMFSRLAALYRYVAVLRKCKREDFDEPMRRLFEERLGVITNPPQWY